MEMVFETVRLPLLGEDDPQKKSKDPYEDEENDIEVDTADEDEEDAELGDAETLAEDEEAEEPSEPEAA